MRYPSAPKFYATLLEHLPQNCIRQAAGIYPLPDGEVKPIDFAAAFINTLQDECDYAAANITSKRALHCLISASYAFLRDYMPINELTLEGLHILLTMAYTELPVQGHLCTMRELNDTNSRDNRVTYTPLDLLFSEIRWGIKQVRKDDSGEYEIVQSGLVRKDGTHPGKLKTDGTRGLNREEDESLKTYSDFLSFREQDGSAIQKTILQVSALLAVILSQNPHETDRSKTRLCALYDVEMLNKQLDALRENHNADAHRYAFNDYVNATLYASIVDLGVSPRVLKRYAMQLISNLQDEIDLYSEQKRI